MGASLHCEGAELNRVGGRNGESVRNRQQYSVAFGNVKNKLPRFTDQTFNHEEHEGHEVNQQPQITDWRSQRSGEDLDVWDGAETRPAAVPVPGDGPCVLWVDGRCPVGCGRCERFRRELDGLSESTADERG